MTKKENKKLKIKNFLLKSLHITCYILSALFILLSVLAGVQSCNKKVTKVSAENEYQYIYQNNKPKLFTYKNNDYYVYKLKYIDNTDLSNFNFNEYMDSFGVSPLPFDSTQPTLYRGDSLDGYILKGSQITPVNSFVADFDTFLQVGYGNYYYRLSYISYLSNGSYVNLVFKTNNDANDFYYTFNSYSILLDKNSSLSDLISPFFELETEQTSFVFNKQFNYNALMGGTLLDAFGNPSSWSGSTLSYDLDVGFFISNGILFNKIRYHVQEATRDTLYWDYTEDKLKAGTGYGYYYNYLEYVNTITGDSFQVNSHDRVAIHVDNIAGVSDTFYYVNSSTWLNDAFRYVTFLEPLNTNLRVTLESFNNNNQSYYNGGLIGNGDNVFDLLSFAFASLTPLFSLYILPSVTIGTLIFLPLVAAIVLIIIKILKK